MKKNKAGCRCLHDIQTRWGDTQARDFVKIDGVLLWGNGMLYRHFLRVNRRINRLSLLALAQGAALIILLIMQLWR